MFKKKRSRDSFSKHSREGTHSLGHNRENAQVVFRLSSLAVPFSPVFKATCELLPGCGAVPRSWTGTLGYQFFTLVNADVLICRFIVLTEGQVPLLVVSITVVLVLISEMLLKWSGPLLIIPWKEAQSQVEKTC